MKLIELKLTKRFRGLPEGFHIVFTRPLNTAANMEVQPLCLVGPNGSGKSNLLQVLANIFYHLELYALCKSGGYPMPDTDSSWALAFSIHYQMPVNASNHLSYVDAGGQRHIEQEIERVRQSVPRNVKITKQENSAAIFEYYYTDETSITSFGSNDMELTMLGRLLPNRVIGYSSGSNEILSNPFVKIDFYYLEEMRRKTSANYNQAGSVGPVNIFNQNSEQSGLTVNRLFYMDYHSNAMMVVANFLMKGDAATTNKRYELDIINDIVGVEELLSFRIRLRLQIRNQMTLAALIATTQQGDIDKNTLAAALQMRHVTMPAELIETLQALIQCATAINYIAVPGTADTESSYELIYIVDGEMKKAFRDHFKGEYGSLFLFQKLYLLNLLNIENYDGDLQKTIKEARYSDDIYDLLPKLPAEERIFYVDNIKLRKNNKAEVYYKQLSDGEHQYMQVAGSLMLMDENATLFLMDEPETHFNPEWRSRLVSTLNSIRQRKKELEAQADQEIFELVQDIMLTTHSPFIISDSQPENVYIFKRDNNQLVLPIPKPDFNTFGASVNLITAKIFGKNETISGMANEQITRLKTEVLAGSKTVNEVKLEMQQLGDSVEKVIFMSELIKMK